MGLIAVAAAWVALAAYLVLMLWWRRDWQVVELDHAKWLYRHTFLTDPYLSHAVIKNVVD